MKRNLLEDIPGKLPEELVTILVENQNVRIERIVSDGHTSAEDFWYDQEQNEWVLLISGSAALSVEKDSGVERVELTSGDHLLIPAHQRHRVECTAQNEQTIWLTVSFEPPAVLEDTGDDRA